MCEKCSSNNIHNAWLLYVYVCQQTRLIMRTAPADSLQCTDSDLSIVVKQGWLQQSYSLTCAHTDDYHCFFFHRKEICAWRRYGMICVCVRARALVCAWGRKIVFSCVYVFVYLLGCACAVVCVCCQFLWHFWVYLFIGWHATHSNVIARNQRRGWCAEAVVRSMQLQVS